MTSPYPDDAEDAAHNEWAIESRSHAQQPRNLSDLFQYRRLGGMWKAWITGSPEKCATGRSGVEAIGAVIQQYFDDVIKRMKELDDAES